MRDINDIPEAPTQRLRPLEVGRRHRAHWHQLDLGRGPHPLHRVVLCGVISVFEQNLKSPAKNQVISIT